MEIDLSISMEIANSIQNSADSAQTAGRQEMSIYQLSTNVKRLILLSAFSGDLPMADDDLDQLLDEVENKYCSPGPTAASYKAAEGDKRELNRHRTRVAEASKEEESLDDVIEDILHVDFQEESKNLKRKPANQLPCNTFSQVQKKTCSPVYAGGSNIPFGIGTNISERACNQLRCTACDFNVVIFDNCEWDTSCDYYFFRNCMPEIKKLETKTIKKKGFRAYACQCSWRNIEEPTDLRLDQQLRWVCGKH